MRLPSLLAAAVVAVAALAGPVAADAPPVTTRVLHVPASPAGAASNVEVHVVTEKGRVPNAAPKPPVAASALAGAGIKTFPAAGPCGDGATPCAATPPAAASVITPAANLAQPVDAITGGSENGPAPAPIVTMGLQTVAGAKIVGVDDKCGCGGASKCDDPCKPVRTVADEIESRLTDVKNEIVNRAQKLQADNVWVKQVRGLIQHYDAKIRAVDSSNTSLKNDIKKLFAKKKHYEDLLLQYSLDKDHFKRVVDQQAANQM